LYGYNISLTHTYKIFLLLIIIQGASFSAKCQYFGKNKPDYEVFDFKIYQTPHFKIYHYLENDSFLNHYARTAELWYHHHQQFFKDTFKNHNPLILYATHPDFQQTRAISSPLGIGTGGVTEALKNRVVMPVMYSNAQTSHVLGHELVHAFQFNSLLRSDSMGFRSLRNLPLWMVEGMAEYLTQGDDDPHTAMWMRDALLHNDFPTLEQMSAEMKYFPYNFGQAFWVYVVKKYGDKVIIPLLKETARSGYEVAIDSVLNINENTFSTEWSEAMKSYYAPLTGDTIQPPPGTKLMTDKKRGDIQLMPAISPDGKYVAYFSERGIFAIDLYLARVETGEVIRKFTSKSKTPHVDDYDFMESAVTWSPDGSMFAMVVVSRGENQLLIINPGNGSIIKRIIPARLPAFSNPAWSPDGRNILVSGLINGQSDLFIIDWQTEYVEQLTFDFAANLQPRWSPDGNYIVYATDKARSERANSLEEGYRLALFDTRIKFEKILPLYSDAGNLNPVFSGDGESIYFLSDQDGFRDLYNYRLKDDSLFRLTKLQTGISGITPFSPAYSISDDTLLFVYFNNKDYTIFKTELKQLLWDNVSTVSRASFAGMLPPIDSISAFPEINFGYQQNKGLSYQPADSFKAISYSPEFKLDYIGNTGIGMAMGRFGSSMAGSSEMFFSDIIGNNQLFIGLNINGEIYDFGGQVSYINNKYRLNWGVSFSHIPFRYGFYDVRPDTVTIDDVPQQVENAALKFYRRFEDKLSLFAFFPISTTRRFEAGAAVSWNYFRLDQYNYYYDSTSTFIGSDIDRKLPVRDGFDLQQIDIAYVFDNSYFGLTSPLKGRRMRLQIEKYFGETSIYTGLVDFRKYFYLRPVTLAFRGFHYGRYGNAVKADEALWPLYLGYPWFLRGVDRNRDLYEQDELEGISIYKSLYGNKMLVANFEIRLPFTGIEQLALIKSRFLLTNLSLFFDGGIAWSNGNEPVLKLKPETVNERVPVLSTGVSLRINLLGAVVLETYYALPMQHDGFGNGVFGINLLPGW